MGEQPHLRRLASQPPKTLRRNSLSYQQCAKLPSSARIALSLFKGELIV